VRVWYFLGVGWWSRRVCFVGGFRRFSCFSGFSFRGGWVGVGWGCLQGGSAGGRGARGTRARGGGGGLQIRFYLLNTWGRPRNPAPPRTNKRLKQVTRYRGGGHPAAGAVNYWRPLFFIGGYGLRMGKGLLCTALSTYKNEKKFIILLLQ
jgi:hypothetical protein